MERQRLQAEVDSKKEAAAMEDGQRQARCLLYCYNAGVDPGHVKNILSSGCTTPIGPMNTQHFGP
eukprot:8075524-Karenia_brevis.AAC.1